MRESTVTTFITLLTRGVCGSSFPSPIYPRDGDGIAFFYKNGDDARSRIVINTDVSTWRLALASPNMSDTDTVRGFDITKPYLEQSPLDGFVTVLNITAKYPSQGSDELFTTMTAIIIIVPEEVAAKNGIGIPGKIDPSWGLCHGYFSIEGASPLEDAVDICIGFLSKECIDQIETSLQDGFLANDSCRYPYKLPPRCQGGGLVLVRDSSEPSSTPDGVFGNVTPIAGFSVGTGFDEKGNVEAYSMSGRKTVLVATMWG